MDPGQTFGLTYRIERRPIGAFGHSGLPRRPGGSKVSCYEHTHEWIQCQQKNDPENVINRFSIPLRGVL